MSDFNNFNNGDDQNVINMVYDLIAQNPIKGCYRDAKGNSIDQDHLTELVESVDNNSQSIYFKYDTDTDEMYKLQLIKVSSEIETWDDIMEFIIENEAFKIYLEQNLLLDEFKYTMLFADKDGMLDLIDDFKSENNGTK